MDKLNKIKEMANRTVADMKQFAKECREKQVYLSQQQASERQQSVVSRQKDFLRPEHERFANAIGRCLASEYEDFGLKRPRQIEDVLCDDSADSICINGNNSPDFIYEAERAVPIVGIRDIGKSTGVPASDIEKKLNRTLKKYSERRGYQFNEVKVDDIPHTRKVRITVQGVSLTPQELLRRGWGQ